MNWKTRFKSLLKRFLGLVGFGLGLNRLLLSRYAVVVAFHRVEGSHPDAMTMPAEEFRKWCRYFAKHFRTVSPEAIVEKLERGRPLNGELAMTFDDAYLDFHSHAVPIMESFGLTGAVFAVSDFVGSDAIPWWDAASGKSYPFMGWRELRDVRDRGFSVGSHGKTHSGMDQLPPDEASDELVLSKAALEAGLEAPVTLYAYPYGDSSRMPEEARVMVKEAGYRACFGYGGLITGGTSPFHIGRVCINCWFGSPEEFGGHLVIQALRGLFEKPGLRLG